MIRVMATRSSMPLSILIRKVFRTESSHIAVSFDDKEVYHSNLMGVHLLSWAHFMRNAEVVESIRFVNSLPLEDEVWQAMTVREGSRYDFLAFIYFAWRGLLSFFFGRPMPSRNPWGQRESFLCTEILSQLPHWISPSDGVDLGITLPEDVMELFRLKFGADRVTPGILDPEKSHGT